MPVDNFEDFEQDNEVVVDIPRGLGDPDAYGYPDEIKDEGAINV